MRPDQPTDLIQDTGRLDALRRTGLLDSPPEESFDRLSRLASRFLRVPVTLVSLVDSDRQFFKSCLGLPEPWASLRQTPLSLSFCRHVVLAGEPRTEPLSRIGRARHRLTPRPRLRVPSP